MYVITGASGHTGSVVARSLLERGERVRVVLRDESKASAWRQWGAEVVLADLHDAAALTLAMMGARGAYLLLPPPPPSSTGVMEDRLRMVDAMRQAVKASGVPHFVLLSSMGAQHAEGTGLVKTLHLAERDLGALGVPMTILRAAYFMENWSFALPPAVEAGVLPSFFGPSDRPIHMVATRDIGEVAARMLLEPALSRRVVELTGPVDYSPDEVADTAARLLGRPVHVEEHNVAAMVPMLEELGFSGELAHLVMELTEAINRGHAVFERPRQFARGRTTLDEVFGGMLRAMKALPHLGFGAEESTSVSQ
ncbi:MAG TPA: NmrA family NAD(P)-binding protein [Archangium sp.]|uniref:NmrA family NAD(P)-binding protein n=1 Tax=Archangium sp. TaxID=1872627 RepID=UPI002ED826BE